MLSLHSHTLCMCVFTPSFAQLLAAKTRERTNIAVWHRVMLFVCEPAPRHTRLGDDLLICFIIWACTWQNSISIAAGAEPHTASKDKTNTSNPCAHDCSHHENAQTHVNVQNTHKAAVGNQLFNFVSRIMREMRVAFCLDIPAALPADESLCKRTASSSWKRLWWSCVFLNFTGSCCDSLIIITARNQREY